MARYKIPSRDRGPRRPDRSEPAGREGVRDVLAPIFLVFVVTHAFVILYSFAIHLDGLPEVVAGATRDFHTSTATLGFWPLAFLLLQAYSMGGGTYTGIEAVSNGVSMLREPRVKTGKTDDALHGRLARLHGGRHPLRLPPRGGAPVEGKTMNAVLFDSSSALEARGGGRRGLRPRHAARRGGGAPLRRRAGGLPRRPARAGEHGDRLVAAAPVLRSSRTASRRRTASS